MDLPVFQSASVLLLVLLGASLALGRECTSGFLNSLSMENYDSRSLLPLFGQFGSSIAEQWIFPSLQFTCSGRLTKWIFRAANAQAQCRINIGTWRLDRRGSDTVYRKLSTTQGEQVTGDGPIFTYEFASPVEVQPDDIAGVEMNPLSNTCPIFGGFDDILSLNIRGNGSISQSYRRIGTRSRFSVRQNPITHLVPFLQPVLESATSEVPTIGNVMFTASNAAENATTTIASTTSSEVEVRTTTISNPLSTTTDDTCNSALVTTSEPRDELTFIVYIVAGVGIGTMVLLGIVVTCIGLVGIRKYMQARSAKERQSDTEKTKVVLSSSNGTLLQENTAYRKLMNSWSTNTTGSGYETLSTEERRNCDTEQLQNTSYSSDNVVEYETVSTEEQSNPDSTQPQDSSDFSDIVVHKNTAYKKSTNRDNAVMGCETMDEIVEQAMQFNLAYGFQGEPQKEMESMDVGDYEMMTGDSVYDFKNQAYSEVDKSSTQAEAVTYDVLIQQQLTYPEDGEHLYDYVV